MVLEFRRPIEKDLEHEQQRRSGRARHRSAEDDAGDDVSRLMPGRAFHARKPQPDRVQLAAKARVRREPRINGNALDADRFDHTLRYGSWSEEARVGLMPGSGASGWQGSRT